MRRTFVLAVALVILGFVFLAPAYIRPDSVAVYSYLRSAVFDRDLSFLNEWNMFGMVRNGFPLFKEITPLGTLANHWWIGTSIASSPFYLAVAAFGARDGFFGVYGWTLAWGAVLCPCGPRLATPSPAAGEEGSPSQNRRGFLAVFAARNDIPIAAVLLGTPLFWYTYRFPLGTHAAGAMFIALAVWAALRERPLLTGLMLGLAIDTRLQHFVLLPAFVILAVRRRLPARAYVYAVAGGILAGLPQAIAWYAVYGSPLGPITSGASLAGSTWMPFHSFAFLAVLFSSYHGLFIWSPVALLAVIGWFEGLRGDRDAALLYLWMFAGEWVANATFDRYWWGGMSFGPRRWVDLAMPFAVGIAWFARSRLRIALIAVATLWSCALTLGALSGTLQLARYAGFGGLWPRLAPIHLHSFVSDPSIDCIVALLVVSAVAAVVFLLRRWTAIYVALISIALAAMIPATREHAREDLVRFRINPKLERVGPLLDERRLLEDEADYLRATGQDARPTEQEIREIDARLSSF